jgi:hypothetical protein
MLVRIYEFCKIQQKRGGIFLMRVNEISYTSITALYNIFKKKRHGIIPKLRLRVQHLHPSYKIY